MYERSYGYKYAEVNGGGYVPTAQLAKLMRAEVKLAKSEGLLPSWLKVSVRSRNYSGGRAIDMNVKFAPELWAPLGECLHYDYCDQYSHYRDCPAAQRLSDEGESARTTLERIHGAYNHDGSDSMTDYFDVNYYGYVKFDRKGE